MDKQKVYEECMGYAKEFVKPYLIKNVCELDTNNLLVFSYMAEYVPVNYRYDVYEDLHRFITLSIKGKYGVLSLWKIQDRSPGIATQMCMLLDECRDAKDYQHIVRIIFCMIRNGIYSKNEFVDAIKDTSNLPALLEIIKYDDFTVMTDNHRFDLA